MRLLERIFSLLFGDKSFIISIYSIFYFLSCSKATHAGEHIRYYSPLIEAVFHYEVY